MKKLITLLFVIAIVIGIILLWPVISSTQQSGESSAQVQSGIVINEVMTSNKGIYPDDKGQQQ